MDANYKHVLVDRPAEWTVRITLNRPEKRNALNNLLRQDLFAALEAADADPTVRVMIIRGAGTSFSAGYDLTADLTQDHPFYTAGGIGLWPRHVVEGAFRIWDLAKPVIAQVHGYCLAGASELASACDLVFVAEDAQIGYPAVRSISPPDNQVYAWLMGLRRAAWLLLTGDSMTGVEAANWGFANAAVSAEALEEHVLGAAQRVAKIPADIQQLNKRALHRQMEAMGIRAGIRAGTELQALAALTPSQRTWISSIREKGLTAALSDRDGAFGDYRTSGNKAE